MKLSIWFFMDSVPFTTDVVEGHTSLGGSESACRGTAEALARLGHDVKIVATKLERPMTVNGVDWIGAESLSQIISFASPDVFVSLRQVSPFQMAIPSALTVLWNQDLLVPPYAESVISGLSQVDTIVYVSEYHKKQWVAQYPYLEPLSWVTKNGFDPSRLPTQRSTRQPKPRLIYISRPERGLRPLLQMWPRIREHWPTAELAIARYDSMYDGEGSNVAQMCASFDEQTEAVQRDVGGIRMLGACNKDDLYREIRRASLMVYPGVADFAETGCIAAVEAQACGTPFVGSWKGAIPETLAPGAGVLLQGDASTEAYQHAFIDTVFELIDGPRARYEAMRTAGFAHVNPGYHFDTIAQEWHGWLHETFRERYQREKPAVLRQLLHWDNHCAAKFVAGEIKTGGYGDVERAEAAEAYTLCERVIAQQEHTPEGYAAHAVKNVPAEMAANTRLQLAADKVLAGNPGSVLDVACGNGTMALLLAEKNDAVHVNGYDYSDGVLNIARTALAESAYGDRVGFGQSAYDAIPKERHDAVFCGEFLEHLERPWELLDHLEEYCVPDGRIVLTTPCGPFAELLTPDLEHQRGHTHAFTLQDIMTMFRDKRNFSWQYISQGHSFRGTPVGYFLLSYQPGGGAGQPLSYVEQAMRTRPYQRLTASMIVKDGADWLRACLKSLWGIVDRVVILDTGSTDGSQAIAAQFGAEVVEAPWPNSFSKARNQALALVEDETEWVLWIDADEQLVNGEKLRRFIDHQGPFVAYVVRQHHLAVDKAAHDDRPQRLFRTGQGIQFYGDVHEQPEQSPDANIEPSIDFADPAAPKIMHFGYYDESRRREKLLHRNLALLEQELRSDSPRALAYVLAIRDHCNLALFEREQHGGRMTERAYNGYMRTVALMQEKFLDPAHKYHDLAYPYYESALQALGKGVTGKWAFAATPGVTMRGSVTPTQIWAASPEELERVTTGKIAAWCEKMRTPPTDVEPVKNPTEGWALRDVREAVTA